MRYQAVRGRWDSAALVAALVLIATGCAPVQQTQSTSSPSPSPSESPSSQASAAALAITSAPFHAGEVGLGYGLLTLGATGGVAPYHWTISAGALPAGLTLSSDGSVTGSPAAAGNFHFSVQVADSAGGTTAASESVAIVPALKASLIPTCVQHCSVEVGCVTVCGNFGTLSGGEGPFTYALQTGGYVPHGTTVTGLSLAGTFTSVAQYWQFTVVVSDALGATAAITPTFYVFPHLSFKGATVTCYYPGCGPPAGYAQAMLPYLGGAGTPAVQVTGWTATCDYPPCGPLTSPTVSAGGGYVSITVPGSSGGNGYKGVLKLLLTDKSLCGAGTYCSVSGTVSVIVQGG